MMAPAAVSGWARVGALRLRGLPDEDSLADQVDGHRTGGPNRGDRRQRCPEHQAGDEDHPADQAGHNHDLETSDSVHLVLLLFRKASRPLMSISDISVTA